MFAMQSNALHRVFSLRRAFGASKINTRAAFTLSQKPYVYGNWSALRQKRGFPRARDSWFRANLALTVILSGAARSVAQPKDLMRPHSLFRMSRRFATNWGRLQKV